MNYGQLRIDVGGNGPNHSKEWVASIRMLCAYYPAIILFAPFATYPFRMACQCVCHPFVMSGFFRILCVPHVVCVLSLYVRPPCATYPAMRFCSIGHNQIQYRDSWQEWRRMYIGVYLSSSAAVVVAARCQISHAQHNVGIQTKLPLTKPVVWYSVIP